MPRLSLRKSEFCRSAFIGAVLLHSVCGQAQTLVQTLAQTAAQTAAGAAADKPLVENSSLDAQMFYQLLIGELELRSGRPANAFEVILDAARRNKDGNLYQRAVEIALQARAADQALAATRAWRTAEPRATDPLRYQVQILLATNRNAELNEPLSAWLGLVPAIERSSLINALPRLLQRANDKAQSLALLETVLAPHCERVETRTACRVAIGRMALAAGQLAQAFSLARQAAADDVASPTPVLLALDLLPGLTSAEPLVNTYLSKAGAEPGVRLSYVRVLTQSQRYADAIDQLTIVTRERPELPEPWLTLGALQLELKNVAAGEAALKRHVDLAQAAPAKSATPAGQAAEADDEGEPSETSDGKRDLTQAWLLLAQAAELRGDAPAAEAWLARVDNPQRALEVQSRRAAMLARQGQMAQARALIQAVPERTGDDGRGKLLAEAQLLREFKRWAEAAQVLATANERYPRDADLIYEWAMVVEKLERVTDMERLLREVIAIKPDHPHAHNALGYSLADRNQRLPEARELIRTALNMSPGDPFITDSLGWVEFRLGNREEAIRLLRQAYRSRPDTEIGAHLGEVLWADGQHDEARRVWLESRGRDAANEVLRETLARLKVGL